MIEHLFFFVKGDYPWLVEYVLYPGSDHAFREPARS